MSEILSSNSLWKQQSSFSVNEQFLRQMMRVGWNLHDVRVGECKNKSPSKNDFRKWSWGLHQFPKKSYMRSSKTMFERFLQLLVKNINFDCVVWKTNKRWKKIRLYNNLKNVIFTNEYKNKDKKKKRQFDKELLKRN